MLWDVGLNLLGLCYLTAFSYGLIPRKYVEVNQSKSMQLLLGVLCYNHSSKVIKHFLENNWK